MANPVFGSGDSSGGAKIDMPAGYRVPTRWVPRIGDIFPNFTAESSIGTLRFHDWAEGAWVYFFSHPEAFTPVCTTELVDAASNTDSFTQRGVKMLNISRDTLDEQMNWVADIEKLFGVRPDFPLVSDPHGVVAEACGMIHPHEDKVLPIRKAFIIGPALRIRMIFEYPMNVGRSIDEVLRVIDALQATDDTGLAAPSSWQPGDPMLVRSDVSEADAESRYGAKLRRLRSYLRFVSG